MSSPLPQMMQPVGSPGGYKTQAEYDSAWSSLRKLNEEIYGPPGGRGPSQQQPGGQAPRSAGDFSAYAPQMSKRPGENIFSAYAPGQAQSQQSPWSTATPYGQQPAASMPVLRAAPGGSMDAGPVTGTAVHRPPISQPTSPPGGLFRGYGYDPRRAGPLRGAPGTPYVPWEQAEADRRARNEQLLGQIASRERAREESQQRWRDEQAAAAGSSAGPGATATPYGQPNSFGMNQQQRDQAMTAWTMPKQQLLQWGQSMPQVQAPQPQAGMNPADVWNRNAALVQQINDTSARQQVGTYLGQGAPPQGWGQTNFNPQQMLTQAQQMIQDGWQNPFAPPPMMQPPGQSVASAPPQPVAGNTTPDDAEPWRNDEYFRRWQLSRIRPIRPPGRGDPDIRKEYEEYLKLPKRDGRILKQDPRREMEELQKRQVADAPYWQGRSDAPSGSVWDHPANWAVRERVLANIAAYDKDPYADTDWAPLPDDRQPANRLPGPPRRPGRPSDPAGDQVRQLLGPRTPQPGSPEPSRIDRMGRPPQLGSTAPDTRSPEYWRPLLDRQRQPVIRQPQPSARPISPGHAAAMQGDSRFGSSQYADFARQQPIFVPNDPSRPHKGGRTVYPGQPGHAAALAKTTNRWHQQTLGWMG